MATTGEIGGGALVISGVGTVAGAPAIAAATAVGVHGVAVGANAGSNLLADIREMSAGKESGGSSKSSEPSGSKSDSSGTGSGEGTSEAPRNYEPSPKHDPQSGWGSPNPIPDTKTGQGLLDSAYSSSKNKQLYNIHEDKLIKFQPDGETGWHPYEVANPAKEVPTDVLRRMVKDGKISKVDYNKMIKNNK